jgi:hypothetical protein
MQSASGGSNDVPFVVLSTNTAVSAGAVTSCVWTGLQSYSSYEWYVTVTDSSGNTTTGALWKFTTAPNSSPTVSNTLLTIYGDAPTNLILTAHDANGDAITFHTNSLPTHGLLKNFVAASGAYSYWPVRGFRGLDRFTFSASDASGSSSVATMNLNVIAPMDSNGNGLPDAWEAAYGVNDPNADDDGDGSSNLQEYWTGTNPTNGASALRITSAIREANGHFDLSWSSVGGTRYRVQYANGGANSGLPQTFTDIIRLLSQEMDGNAYGTPSTQSFVDDFALTGPPTNGARFYRVKVVQ